MFAYVCLIPDEFQVQRGSDGHWSDEAKPEIHLSTTTAKGGGEESLFLVAYEGSHEKNFQQKVVRATIKMKDVERALESLGYALIRKSR